MKSVPLKPQISYKTFLFVKITLKTLITLFLIASLEFMIYEKIFFLITRNDCIAFCLIPWNDFNWSSIMDWWMNSLTMFTVSVILTKTLHAAQLFEHFSSFVSKNTKNWSKIIEKFCPNANFDVLIKNSCLLLHSSWMVLQVFLKASML